MIFNIQPIYKTTSQIIPKEVLLMKAYIHTAKTSAVRGNDPFHGHEIRLTVGMIVKNEEKNLEKCLNALKPLLDAVPSELIVTDTGSTDRTVEIAQKYTDHIIHYEWNDDFSAARNTGLDAARRRVVPVPRRRRVVRRRDTADRFFQQRRVRPLPPPIFKETTTTF
jgi:cellulose synthase/poly-beta-1,6-N-acetylglucosamine synthase-like glycosyltransferase